MASYFNGGLGDLDGFFLNDKGVGGCLIYKTGTASQSTNTITGSGTSFTSAMVGGIVVWADNTRSFITGYTSGLLLTAVPSQTIGSQSFVIYYDSIQATSGYIGMVGANISGITPASLLGVDESGNFEAAVLAAGQVYIGTTSGFPSATTISSGTAINVVSSSGNITVNNTGVTSLAGTANQSAVSAATGAVTISTPATFIAPGTVSDTTGMRYSTTGGITALGSTQGGATGLSTSYNVVTTVTAGTGVVLPTGVVGLRCVIVNRGANPLNVYPALGAAIDAAATNVAVTLPIGASATYEALSATQWYTVDAPLSAGTSTTVNIWKWDGQCQ